MKYLEVINVGPIKEVKLDLNRVNVFIGEQSVGKSTLAKIISYCQWAEKRFILDTEFNYSFHEQFIEFHRVDENYFNETSFIKYESEFVSISYSGKDYIENITKKTENLDFLKSKNIYIPAERNFVSTIPNLGKFKELNDNIMSFLYDWYDTKQQYSKKNSLPILNLDVKYHHLKDSDSDIISLNSNNTEIPLKNASSGLQSVIPLMILIDYLTQGFYNKKKSNSVKEKEAINSVVNKALDEFIENENKKDDFTKKDIERLLEIVSKRALYHHTNFIIEEPEQNLFPKTQKDLIYFLLSKLNSDKRAHNLILTTHSPYILYAINNCIMAAIVKDKLSENEKSNINSYNSRIDPKSISIYQIKDGYIKCIQETDGLISENFLDEQMKEIMDDFYLMLNHY